MRASTNLSLDAREYPAAEELGIPFISNLTKIVPFDKTSGDASDADRLLSAYATQSGFTIYAALDLRRSEDSKKGEDTPMEAMVFLYSEPGESGSSDLTNQINKYYAHSVHVDKRDVVMTLPGVLPFQLETNLFLRNHSTNASANASSVSPSTTCSVLNEMLASGGILWTDLPTTSPLGNSTTECAKAVKKGGLSAQLTRFLDQLVTHAASQDELSNVNANFLPDRPRTTVSGMLEQNIIFYMTYLFLWPFTRLVRDIVMEKEKQLKEYLLIMGLHPMALLMSWFLLYFAASLVVVVLAVFMLGDVMFVATHASSSYFFILLLMFVVSILLFALAITPIFNQTKTAAAGAPLLYVLLAVAPFIKSMVGEDVLESYKIVHFVVEFMEQTSSPVTFMDALHDVLALDALSGDIRPIAWTTIYGPCWQMMFQSVGYLLLGWYLENVFPRTFGVRQRWYFIVLPSYWISRCFPSTSQSADEGEKDELLGLEQPTESDQFSASAVDHTLREMPLSEFLMSFKPILFVKGLFKRYPDGKEAVKNVSFGVKKGEIFGLLGPNGAGKSTIMSILCGMLPPTAGDAFVGAKSVSRHPDTIRKSLSVCFQQNILFDDLSVWEHLYLVCELKSAMGIKTLDKEACEFKLRQFGLDEKRDALSKNLSGGQKRKLSLVLALIDTSHVVLLDEPTAGMDLKARLDTWDVLKRTVHNRAVILTTHSMQEAEALCENIGIVAEGELKCCGSSLFLRERFGVGYKLTLVHRDDQQKGKDKLEMDDKARAARDEARTSSFVDVIQKYVPKAEVVSDNKWETRFQLTDGKEAHFTGLFEELERMKTQNQIKRYAIAATDLEDVFVRVTEGEAVYFHAKDDKNDSSASDAAVEKKKRLEAVQRTQSISSISMSTWEISMTQIKALIVKRWKMMIRDKKTLLAQYIWPIALFTILVAILQHLFNGMAAPETITMLPSSAFKSSILVASNADFETPVQSIIDEFVLGAHSVVYSQAASESDMLNVMLKNYTGTTFFAGVFVSNVSSLTAPSSDLLEYSLFYNKSIARSLPVAIEWMSQGFCKALLNATHTVGDCDLVVKKAPIFRTGAVVVQTEATSRSKQDAMDISDVDAISRRIMVAFYLLITMSSIASFYVSSVVKEKENGLKRLQYLHLASRNASAVYWSSHFLFDLVGYLLATGVICFVLLVLFSASMTLNMLAAWMVSMLLFGFAVLPFMYTCSLVFSSHSSAQSFMSYVSFFQILATSVVFVISMVPGLCSKVKTITFFLQFFPLFTFGNAVLNVAALSWAPIRNLCFEMTEEGNTENQGELVALMMNSFAGGDNAPKVWDWEITGSQFVALALSGIMYWILLFAFDQLQMYPSVAASRCGLLIGWVRRLFNAHDYVNAGQLSPYHPDDLENPTHQHTVQVSHVTKVYNPKGSAAQASDSVSSPNEAPNRNEQGQVIALSDVTFSVEENDCIALLGVNGSGKSTMFEILTGGIAPTSGHALVDRFDATLQPQEASEKFGYCPQTNIFFGEMSVREHLELVYRLRCRRKGSPQEEKSVIATLMDRLDLFPVEKTPAEHLSGGNKRRLMLALSFLSEETSLLLLDEPSAGVDVVARRLMWRVLYETQQSDRKTSCVFTTHSMEEAEAVCANAVILFKGKRVWAGSIPDLKQHVARGISISLRLDTKIVWEPERVHAYGCLVYRMLFDSDGETEPAVADVVEGRIPMSELKNAWKACRAEFQASKPMFMTAEPSEESSWIENLTARLEDNDEDIHIMEFVKEWLVQETFERVEGSLFKAHFTARSGQEVKRVALQSAASATSATYETSCTDTFGLSDVFALLEAHKYGLAIAAYSVSELSLERVFEQFT